MDVRLKNDEIIVDYRDVESVEIRDGRIKLDTGERENIALQKLKGKAVFEIPESFVFISSLDTPYSNGKIYFKGFPTLSTECLINPDPGEILYVENPEYLEMEEYEITKIGKEVIPYAWIGKEVLFGM